MPATWMASLRGPQVDRTPDSQPRLLATYMRYWRYYALLLDRTAPMMHNTPPRSGSACLRRVKRRACARHSSKSVRRLVPKQRQRMTAPWWLLRANLGGVRAQLAHASALAAVVAITLNVMLLFWLEADWVLRSRGASLNGAPGWVTTVMTTLVVAFLVLTLHAMAVEWAVWGRIRFEVRRSTSPGQHLALFPSAAWMCDMANADPRVCNRSAGTSEATTRCCAAHGRASAATTRCGEHGTRGTTSRAVRWSAPHRRVRRGGSTT